jgi:hypothetical protein
MQRSMWGVVRIFMVLSSLLLICAAAVTEGSKQRYLTVRLLINCSFSYTRKKTEPKEGVRVPRFLRVAQPNDKAAPHAAIRRCPALREFSSLYMCFGDSQACSGAHNLAIAARLAPLGTLPVTA